MNLIREANHRVSNQASEPKRMPEPSISLCMTGETGDTISDFGCMKALSVGSFRHSDLTQLNPNSTTVEF